MLGISNNLQVKLPALKEKVSAKSFTSTFAAHKAVDVFNNSALSNDKISFASKLKAFLLDKPAILTAKPEADKVVEQICAGNAEAVPELRNFHIRLKYLREVKEYITDRIMNDVNNGNDPDGKKADALFTLNPINTLTNAYIQNKLSDRGDQLRGYIDFISSNANPKGTEAREAFENRVIEYIQAPAMLGRDNNARINAMELLKELAIENIESKKDDSAIKKIKVILDEALDFFALKPPILAACVGVLPEIVDNFPKTEQYNAVKTEIIEKLDKQLEKFMFYEHMKPYKDLKVIYQNVTDMIKSM